LTVAALAETLKCSRAGFVVAQMEAGKSARDAIATGEPSDRKEP
jgi:hypothetical protein